MATGNGGKAAPEICPRKSLAWLPHPPMGPSDATSCP